MRTGKLFLGMALIVAMLSMPLSTSALILPGTDDLRPLQVTEITLGGLFPLTGGLQAGGVERDAAARMAVKEINQDDTLLKGVTLKISVRDTATDPNTGATAASELISQGVVGLIGAASSGVSKSVQGVAAQSKIPQISYSSTNPDLSDKSQYPYFFRVVPSDALQGKALAQIVKEMGIKEVATLATSGDYGLGGIEVFETEAEALGITILTSQKFAEGETNVLTQLQAIKDSGAHVIVLNAVVQDTITVFSQVEDVGLSGKDYLWIGTDGPTQEQVFETSPDTKAPMQGMIGTRPNVGSGEVYDHFIQLWKDCYGESENVYAGCGDTTPNTYATFAYDAVYVFAHALDKMLADGKDVTDGATLKDYIKQTDFVGATGRITFDENQDRNGIYDVVNLQGDKFEIVGSWSKLDGLQITDTIVWPGGSTDQPDFVNLDTGSSEKPAPGFEFYLAFISIFAVVAIVRRRRN